MCHIFVAEYKHDSIWAKIIEAKNLVIQYAKILLGVQLDRKLSFNEHVSNLCEKFGQKLSALAMLSSYMSLKQRRILMKAFVDVWFSHFSRIWMFYGKVLNWKSNHLHERLLQIAYRSSTNSFCELL